MSSLQRLQSLARHAMIERGFEPEFSAAALDELSRIRAAPRADGNTRDLTDLPWLSIDNDDSRDLDQLSVADAISNDITKVLVAIADVDGLVHKGSAIDDHARLNTTSVYTPAQIFPMLPEKLSTDLTSLADHQNRAAVVVEMHIDSQGNIRESDVYRAFVFNRAKLAYNSVSAWLEGNAPAPAAIADSPELQRQIKIQDAAARNLRALRHTRGALTLETIQAEAVFQDGELRDLRAAQKNRAKELIEDLMVAANGVTARFLSAKGLPSLRRVLKTPRRWDRIVKLAAEQGAHLDERPSAKALSEFMEKQRAANPAGFAELSLAVIKMLGSGEYGVEVPGEEIDGHFGLAVSDYTHSTAPNRRFPDLVTQRMVKAVLAGAAPAYSAVELKAIASHCTEQEDDASKVERQVRKSAAAMLLESRVGQRFDAIVTGAGEKGVWVRINHPVAEGKLVRGEGGLDVGDRVRVHLISVDVERGFVDFARTT
ncbi:MAG TPA: RNB domain-containing ribonuclease [Steroidobacteraceae bacterium]|nr:RNB domain-containing ribonuclease [Steroidobacteraceae bacterium]